MYLPGVTHLPYANFLTAKDEEENMKIMRIIAFDLALEGFN